MDKKKQIVKIEKRIKLLNIRINEQEEIKNDS